MTRCMTCNGILRKGEKVCYTCGDGAPGYEAPKPFAKRFANFVTLLFFASLVLTPASYFFSDRTPPFSICLTATVILLFLKRSADQVAKRHS